MVSVIGGKGWGSEKGVLDMKGPRLIGSSGRAGGPAGVAPVSPPTPGIFAKQADCEELRGGGNWSAVSAWTATGGRDAEIAAVYEREAGRLVAYLVSMDGGLGWQDAEDLAHEAFLVMRER
jgi:hypothetical protein